MDKLDFWKILAVVFIAELPCLLRTVCIQLQNKGIWSVIWGTMAGNLLALVIGIAIAKGLTTAPEAWFGYLEKAASIALISLGFYLLMSGHDH